MPDLLEQPPPWLEGVPWKPLFAALVALSIFTVVVSAVVLPWILVRLPPDHLVRPQPSARAFTGHVGRKALHVLRNVVALLLFTAGVLMLFLPGQGVLTMLAAAILSDLPGKHRLERALLSRRRVLQAVNALRRRAHRPPLEAPSSPGDDRP